MLPELFCERMKLMLGDEYQAFIDSYDQPKKQALRFNLCKVDLPIDEKNFPFDLSPIPWEEAGFCYEDGQRPGKSVFHEAGVYYIQEPSAMTPAAYLEVKPGDYVLDLCAAPGGKSTQIASYLKQEGLLVSNEIHPQRARILAENIERMGLRNCIVTNESSDTLLKKFPGYFDKIMVDAPCSGEGMFRKNEDATYEWSLDNVKLCSDRQDEILDNAASMLRAGGRMVFSTCTFAPLENEGSIARFLESHPDFHVVKVPLYDTFSKGNPDWVSKELTKLGIPASGSGATYSDTILSQISDTIRLWPHITNGEGHFVAVLQKDGVLDTISRPECRDGLSKSISEKDCKDLLDFLKDETNLGLSVFGKNSTKDATQILDGPVIKFGDQLYLLPNNAPSIQKSKVLRPGLHLGTILKNRFEPSHALALYCKAKDVKHTVDLSFDDPRAIKYVNGETFPYDKDKGWYLITVNGYSLGWGKCAGGQMKNHYPKGLRKQL